MDFWDFFWLLVWSFFFVAYLMVLFQIAADVIRDDNLGGGIKAVWIICLVFFPVVTALVYLIARGKGMGERHLRAARAAQSQTDDYVRSVAGTQQTPADQIASAKALLDSGTVTQEEFDQLKAKALR